MKKFIDPDFVEDKDEFLSEQLRLYQQDPTIINLDDPDMFVEGDWDGESSADEEMFLLRSIAQQVKKLRVAEKTHSNLLAKRLERWDELRKGKR